MLLLHRGSVPEVIVYKACCRCIFLAVVCDCRECGFYFLVILSVCTVKVNVSCHIAEVFLNNLEGSAELICCFAELCTYTNLILAYSSSCLVVPAVGISISVHRSAVKGYSTVLFAVNYCTYADFLTVHILIVNADMCNRLKG